ncbi:MAG: EAL domain-containing protein [Sphingomicrobium sp.]
MDVVARTSAEVPKSAVSAPEPTPWKLLLWTAVAGLIFGLIGFGEIAEDWLRITRNGFHKHSASGDIVIVAIDDKSLHEVGNWPWPRRIDAALLDRISAAEPKQVLFDINFSFRSNPVDDARFAAALQRAGNVSLFTRSTSGSTGKLVRRESGPIPAFRAHSKLGLASYRYNYQNAIWRIPYGTNFDGEKIRSFAAALADIDGPADVTFPIDYSTDVESIPTYSAVEVLNGRIADSKLKGKNVIIGTAADVLNDNFFIPGHGLAYGVQVHALGGETLRRGIPTDVPWWMPALLAFGAAAFAMSRHQPQWKYACLSAAIAVLLVVPLFFEARLIFVDVTPSLFILAITLGALGWRQAKQRGLVNAVSKLPNLNALQAHRPGRNKAIVAARLLNYEEALSTLPPGNERQLVDQIVSRLAVGTSSRTIYQGDGGIFVWFAEPGDPFGNHLEALHALFRNPARVGKLSVDLAVTFGVEVGSGRSISSRLASALVAADEAARDGLKWRHHDPESLQNASWRLSMLSQLDQAIDKGEVWVAYQPKLELATKRIVGAEALARWTHPEKGPIAASEFVAAAEQHNRIGKLTDFVLEQAVKNAAQINRRDGEFEMAVNMSASVMSDKGFVLRLSALLARHGLAPKYLILELTETAALASSGEGLDMIGRLRDLGVGISIDDYGTGLSTLDYLKRVPANEIKIDQSFVKGIVDSRSDRLMVQSTIELAHSLGRRVVAEGAEQREIVDLLTEMNCDIAQGYAIGRPMSLESLARRLATDRKRSAA